MLPNLTKFKEFLSPLYDSAEARSLYYMVLTELLDCDMTTLLLRGDQLMTEEKVERFDEITQKLCEGQPIQHILGYAQFHGNRFFVNPNVLVPRPETEELVDWILQDESHPSSLLDIGTGSGCIGISLAYYMKNIDYRKRGFYSGASMASQKLGGFTLIKSIRLNKLSGNWALVTVIDIDKLPKLAFDYEDDPMAYQVEDQSLTSIFHTYTLSLTGKPV